MKIGELNMHCGECGLIDYCDEPFSEVAICMESRLAGVDEDIFYKYLESSKIQYNNYNDEVEWKQAVIDDAYKRMMEVEQ